MIGPPARISWYWSCLTKLDLGLGAGTISCIRDGFASDPPIPVALTNALPQEVALNLLRMFDEVRGWRREYFVEEFLGGTRRVDQETFAASAPADRFASWATVDLEILGNKPPLGPLLEFLRSPHFLQTLEALGRPGVKPPSLKLRRYRAGDFFSSHCDGDRGLGVLIHFTEPPWREGDGGRLIYEPSTGDELCLPPLFNSAVFLPYSLKATHRVEPVAHRAATRYTLSCDFA